jgi:hypothetical protein
MTKRPHIFLGKELAETIDFSLKIGGGDKFVRECNIAEHASKLRSAYDTAISQAKVELAKRGAEGKPTSNGYYLHLDIDKNTSIPFKQLDASRKGPKLMQIGLNKNNKNEVESQSATIYLPRNNENWLSGKLDEYEVQRTKSDQPRNKPLINAMDNVNVASARQLFPQPSEYDTLLPNIPYDFEIWIDNEVENIEILFGDIDRMGFVFERNNILQFDSVTIILVRGVKETIDDIPFALDDIEAIKRYYNPAETLQNKEANRDWAQLLSDNIIPQHDGNSPRIGIFDRGINCQHPMLQQFLPIDRCKSVVDDRPLYYEGVHGTGMAGLSLFGDLTDQMGNPDKLIVNHDLVSVKLQTLQNPNPPQLYGKLTIDAINESEALGANIYCMAITEDKENNDGIPTSWSAAIDQALYNEGECNRLMVLAAGSTSSDVIRHGLYIDDLIGQSIQSPCEALNAIVVGSYTTKVHCIRDGYVPEAPVNGISPYTRTSMHWKGSKMKPDIVMEGGNMGYRPILRDSSMPELSLISTSSTIPNEPLQDFCATSASSALAARLAARIKYANPKLSMLSVRALMIHSAEWTGEMKKIDRKKGVIMAFCGYGVPNEKVAIASDDTAATFIFENELTPFQVFKNTNVYKEMHFYDLPWPQELLLDMGAENVKLKVTLSYYIEPSPTQKGTYNKYRYQSAGLVFDVKTANESREQFIARHNRNHPVEDRSSNNSERWVVGLQLRSSRTVQSDWFECSAAELATCNEIVVYPTSGWWKYRKLDHVANKIKYSLVVTIYTESTPIYDAIESLVKQKVVTEVEA